MFSRLETLLGRENDRGLYHFTPVESPRHIRTVHLQPAASPRAPLCCTISSLCLDDGFDEEVGID
ncbi:hypothetical protein BDZ45DRAFT_336316 [Acephala macrosclerotiorum]|nr:hypothetical protein BDZ45DRAFT_336316 [Acephala macrosclerotiorum]